MSRIDSYPPQEPLSEAGARYAAEVLRRGDAVEREEVALGADPYQSLLICRPARPTGAVVAMLHGGGWTSGYKEWMAFMAPCFTDAGILFASIGYRLAPQHLFPAGLEDAMRGVAWLHAHAARYDADPARLFLGGHSAGGHYAALLAVRRDWQQDHGLPRDVIRGCLPISGVYDFTEGSGLTTRPRFLGPEKTERAASPLHALRELAPPFLLAHGDADFPHLMRQAEIMEKALTEQGGRATRIMMPGRNHFSAHFAGGELDGPWVPHTLRFIAET